jgi:hypothetical protein
MLNYNLRQGTAFRLSSGLLLNAERHPRDLASLADIRSAGATRLRAFADVLNARGMLTRSGGR